MTSQLQVSGEITSGRRTVHVLSQRSISQKRDMFLFYDVGDITFEPGGGLDTSRHALSIETLYRWLDILDNEPEEKFELWPITVVRYNVFTYAARREGSPLPRTSKQPLSPGDYGAYSLKETVMVGNEIRPYVSDDPNDDKYIGKAIGPDKCYASFAKREETRRRNNERFPLKPGTWDNTAFTEEMVQKVQARDGGVCFILGTRSNTTRPVWLIPPPLASLGSLVSENERDDSSELTKEHWNYHNIITLDESLYGPFMENKFGVDVKDDYKIVVFQDFPGSEKLALNAKLPLASIEALTDQSYVYLQENFKYCLGVNFLGGDIREDYPDYGREFIRDVDEYGWGSPDDAKWQTPVGRELLDFYRDDIPSEFLPLLQ